jgi:hypothetical protein
MLERDAGRCRAAIVVSSCFDKLSMRIFERGLILSLSKDEAAASIGTARVRT